MVSVYTRLMGMSRGVKRLLPSLTLTTLGGTVHSLPVTLGGVAARALATARVGGVGLTEHLHRKILASNVLPVNRNKGLV
jgi:hypothetical protein